jgi:hypothetical protein
MQISPVNSIDIERRKEQRMKLGVTATTVAATGMALAHIAKRQGFSLSPSVIKKTPMKDWALFGLYSEKHPNRKLIEVEEKEILELATASVTGGLIGGLIFDDKKYRKSKQREFVNQLLGNVLIPVACVGSISRLYKANKTKILSKVPQLKGDGKVKNFVNKALMCIPFSIATISSLVTGIFAGNRVSNYLNEKVFHKKVDRKIKGTDFAPHVDDIGMAVSLMAEKSAGASLIQRTVPAFLCVPGYETGTHRD